MFGFCWSGWQDSNLRPPAPKAGAITGLRYTPKKVIYNLKESLRNRLFMYMDAQKAPQKICGLYPLKLRFSVTKAERPGLEPGRHLRVDRLAICSVTTPAPLLSFFKEQHCKMRLQM